MRHIDICRPLRSTILSHTNSKTERFTGKKVIKHKMCELILSETFIILRRTERDRDKKYVLVFV